MALIFDICLLILDIVNLIQIPECDSIELGFIRSNRRLDFFLQFFHLGFGKGLGACLSKSPRFLNLGLESIDMPQSQRDWIKPRLGFCWIAKNTQGSRTLG